MHDILAEEKIVLDDVPNESSKKRDIAAGREPELDAIPGSVLRAAARHHLECPTVQRLTAQITERAGIAPPLLDSNATSESTQA